MWEDYHLDPGYWKRQLRMVEEEIKSLERVLNDPSIDEDIKEYVKEVLDKRLIQHKKINAIIKALESLES